MKLWLIILDWSLFPFFAAFENKNGCQGAIELFLEFFFLLTSSKQTKIKVYQSWTCYLKWFKNYEGFNSIISSKLIEKTQQAW